jgi:hypothetical protein
MRMEVQRVEAQVDVRVSSLEEARKILSDTEADYKAWHVESIAKKQELLIPRMEGILENMRAGVKRMEKYGLQTVQKEDVHFFYLTNMDVIAYLNFLGNAKGLSRTNMKEEELEVE